MSTIRWKITDPLGNELRLSEENFRYHVTGMHDEKDALTREQLEEKVRYTLQQPCFIVKDKNIATRRVYLNLVDVQNDETISIRPLCVVVEENGEVVTWFATRTINIKVQAKGGIIYDRRVRDLQIRQEI